jgi:hypothetical protein
MLEKILSPFTTATSLGVTLRYLTAIVGSLLAILGAVGFLTPEQVDALKAQIEVLTANAPALLSAIGAVMASVVTIYATITKSSSNKAAEVAKEVDANIPKEQTVVIQTPPGQDDIIVTAKK